MRIIRRKSEIRVLIGDCHTAYQASGLSALVRQVDQEILSNKVKFPLLEFTGKTIYDFLPEKERIPFCDQIEALKAEGGNVLLGIILQQRLHTHYEETIHKAIEYISRAHIWYVCDIIGERVWGIALLTYPEQTTVLIRQRMPIENRWVLRSFGAGIHYAIKKGLPKPQVAPLFELLLSQADSTDKEVRQGIGWAAKTTAKFHPEVIRFRESIIRNTDKVSPWFRAKIKIGLERYAYAQSN